MDNLDIKLKQLKNICAEKKETANKLYINIVNSIINRDIKLLFEKRPDIKNMKPDYYRNEYLEYSITNNVLQIIDNKRHFMWSFEAILDDRFYRLGDAFEFNGRVYVIESIEKIDNEEILSAIENVINEYEDTINYLNSNTDFTKYKYYYYFEKEDKEYPTIFDVYEEVDKYYNTGCL